MSPQDIISKVSTSFDKALDSKDIFFFPSTIIKHAELDIEVRELAPIVCTLTSGKQFEIRLCPALKNKPQQLSMPDLEDSLTSDAVKYDPFMPPYSPNLHVGDLQNADGQEYAMLVSRPSESLTVDGVIEYAPS